MQPLAKPPLKGRGAVSNPEGRFESLARNTYDDGWTQEEETAPLKTTVSIEHCRSIIARNDSPDIGFSQSINPYRGCEHGCIYCYARPSHSYVGLSAGLDFETRLFAKTNAAENLRIELSKPGYQCSAIALGSNTDPYQPVERVHGITRQIIEVLVSCEHPLTIVTKSSLVERDIDLLAPMAQKHLIKVYVSITTLDRKLARSLEPRACAPQRRLETLRNLAAAGIPAGVMVAPVIPTLTDSHLENILELAHDAGAISAGYIFLRLPYEVKDLFREWLATHAPLKAKHVMSLVRASRDGKDYDSTFGVRMRGQGQFAEIIEDRFAKACRRLGLNQAHIPLDHERFRPPINHPQLDLFK